MLQWIGIPTCIGIGPTKSLAKMANHIAKKNVGRLWYGVCDIGALTPEAERLGRQSLHANHVQVFIRTSPFKRDDPQYSRAINVPLVSPTSDMVYLAISTKRCLHREP